MSLTTLTVSTHNPTKYTLHDHETGDVWCGTDGGHWVRDNTLRQAARVDESAIERLRNALKMFDEHRTTMQSLASSVGDFLREAALSAQPAQPAWMRGLGNDGGHYDKPAERQGEAKKRWPFAESPGEFTERLRDAMRHFPLIGAVRHVLIENPPVIDTHPAAPVGVPDESIEENGKWYVLMDGARYEVSQIEAEGWDYCVSYLQKLNAATSPAPQAVDVIHLTPHEIQSGLDRVRHAELLIRQLPEDHDGRNTWLLNYGQKSAPQGVECQHSWVTDGINPTCCSKCKRPAMPTHPTERK